MYAQTRNSFSPFLLACLHLQITDFKLSIDVVMDNEHQVTMIFKRIIHLYTRKRAYPTKHARARIY